MKYELLKTDGRARRGRLVFERGVVETPDACYLMTVEGRKSAQFRPLTEVRADIEKILRSDEQARLQRAWIDGLKKKNFVRYLNNSRTEY